jgi:hypothetical protein
MKNLSPLFEPEDKPVRIGVYRIFDESNESGGYAYFDGKKFGFRIYDSVMGGQSAINEAFEMRDIVTVHPPLTKWMGLTK